MQRESYLLVRLLRGKQDEKRVSIRIGIWHRGIGMIAAAQLSCKRRERLLDVAGRRSGVGCDCRVEGRSATASFAFQGGAAAIAFDVHLEDGGVMNEAVNDSNRHRVVREDLAPFAKGLVGGDQQRAAFVAGANKLKEDAGFSLVFGDVGEVIEGSGGGIYRAWRWRLRERAR